MGHAPAPSQFAPAVATPPLQSALRHAVVGYAHAAIAEPSHAPPHAVPSVAHGGRPPVGAPVTGVHVPVVPERLHAAHCCVHAVSQQTPSTQLPLRHWFVAAHATPAASFGTHAPPAQ